MSDRYEVDMVLWSERQAELPRRRAAGELANEAELDWLNIAEEIESMGRSDTREVRSRLARLCQHLLKWAYQPEGRSASWRGTIRQQRRQLDRLIEESPSLRAYAAAAVGRSYADGLDAAAEETGLLALPAACPWSIEQLLGEAFWP